MDRLSLATLLNWLEVDHCANDSDRQLRILCDKVGELSGSRHYGAAINKGLQAVRLAEEKFNHNLHGIALLHLSLARHLCKWPYQHWQAVRDCEVAIANLSPEPFNHAIAEIFRAQLEQETLKRDFTSRECALAHLQRAVDRLQELIADWRTPISKIGTASEILHLINTKIAELVAMPVEVPGDRRTSSESVEPEPKPSPLSSMPTAVVWPGADLAGWRLAPVSSLSLPRPGADQAEFGPDQIILNTIQVNQITINGRPYAIYPVNLPSSTPGVLSLNLGQKYLTFRVQEHEESNQPGKYVLVRTEERPEQAASSSTKRTWVVYEAISYRIIGGTESVDKDQRERQWGIAGRLEDLPYDERYVRIIGVVEAYLSPASSSDLSDSTDDENGAEPVLIPG